MILGYDDIIDTSRKDGKRPVFRFTEDLELVINIYIIRKTLLYTISYNYFGTRKAKKILEKPLHKLGHDVKLRLWGDTGSVTSYSTKAGIAFTGRWMDSMGITTNSFDS